MQVCTDHLDGACRGVCPHLHVKNRSQVKRDIAAKKTRTPCTYHLRGACRVGKTNCPYLHVLAADDVVAPDATALAAPPGDRWVSPGVRAASRVRGKMRDLDRARAVHLERSRQDPDAAGQAELVERLAAQLTDCLTRLAAAIDVSIGALEGGRPPGEPRLLVPHVSGPEGLPPRAVC